VRVGIMDNPLKKPEQATCVCNRSDGLFIPSRQVSFLVASLLMMFFITFLGGYFFGKKYMVEQFVAKIEQDSFADQIYSSLCALGECDPEELRALAAQESGGEVTDMCEATDQEPQEAAPLIAQTQQLSQEEPQMEVQEVASVDQLKQEIASQEVPINTKSYYALLAGYGTELAADKFVKRLAQKNISAITKKHISKTAKGAQRSWFQVVTREYSDRDTLQKLVDRITKEEKLKGVSIVTC